MLVLVKDQFMWVEQIKDHVNMAYFHMSRVMACVDNMCYLMGLNNGGPWCIDIVHMLQKGHLRNREFFDNRCVSFIQFKSLFIVVII